MTSAITENDLAAARQAWGDALVSISVTFEDKGIEAAAKLAGQVIDSAYGYSQGPVMFKPTLSSGEKTFRPTREGALSYFVGGSIREDKGFALKPWKKVRFGDRYFILEDHTALVMGNYYFQTSSVSEEVRVEYTFGYIKNDNGELIINLHHSSLPYQGD